MPADALSELHSPPPRMIAAKLVYFGWFAMIGAYMPFITLYYREIGLDLVQIGLLVALSSIVQMFAAPVWSLFADALRVRRILLPLAIVSVAVPVLLLAITSSSVMIFGLALLLAFFSAPVIALTDSATLEQLGEYRDRYGAQRIWGAIGWGTSTFVFGWLIQRYGYGVGFSGAAILAVLTAGAALALPRTAIAAVAIRSAAGTLLRDRRWAVFLGGIFLISCAGGVINSFLSLYLSDMGASDGQVGLAQTIASVSELPVMALSSLVLRRWSARTLLTAAGLLYALRMGLYIIAPSVEWSLAVQGLHGLCFGALWMAGVVEAQRLAPPGLESTAQSLLGLAVFSLASTMASALGGQIYRDFGVVVLFGLAGAVALIGSLVLLAGGYRQQHADA